MSELLQALALVLVIEGLAYALFPGALKTMMKRALSTPEDGLRIAGILAVAAGVGALWLLRTS